MYITFIPPLCAVGAGADEGGRVGAQHHCVLRPDQRVREGQAVGTGRQPPSFNAGPTPEGPMYTRACCLKTKPRGARA
eukprot:5449292-Pyramimonas_sp.AAC.1